MLVCLSVLKYDSWVYEKFYSNKKHVGGGSSCDPLVIITTNSRVTATTVVVFFCIVPVLGYRHYRNWRGGLCKKAKVGNRRAFAIMNGVIKKGNACGLVDVLGNVGYIPPPKFSVSTFPSPLEIKQGEEKTIELRINSSTLARPVVDLKPDLEQAPDGVNVSIEPNKIEVPPAGIATSHIKIKVPEKIAASSYIVPIILRISFPATVTLDVNPFIGPTSNSTVGSRGPNI